MTPLISLFFLLCTTSILGYKRYQSLMPNGERVHHPCFPNQFWQGVGHMTKQGGNANNPFGLDFKNAGHTWTRELCMKDSDGDGRTNGDELGDPKCLWSPGKTPERVSNISHPGVCQPLTSNTCKKRNGRWNVCVPNKLVCPAIQSPDVINMTLRFTRTNIPKKVTNYYCQAFEMSNKTDYHMIAHEPVIDNAEIMHHALMFGCEKKPDARFFKNPQECGMGGSACQQLIGLWGLGAVGQCLPDQFGIKFGPTGYKHLMIQYHWNNVGQRSDLYDASAFRFYLTPKMRPHQGAVMTTGQRYLELPPGKSSVTQESTCTSDCTKMIKHALNVTSVIPHMHYAGKFAEAYQYRNGKKIRDLLKFSAIVYDEPLMKSFKTPIEFLPGDEIKLKCHFKTTDHKEIMYYGDSTQDEMCFLFLMYYPATNVPYCLNYGPIDMCGIYLPKNGGTGTLPGNVGKCNIGTFMSVTLSKKWGPMLDEFCDYSISACRLGCMNVLKRMKKEEPCWQGWAKKYLEFLALYSFNLGRVRLQLSRCEAELELIQRPPVNGPSTKPPKISDTQAILIGVGCGAVLLLVVTVVIIGILKTTGSGKMKKQPNIIDERTSGLKNEAYVYDASNTKF